MKDKAFLAEADKAQLEITPISGEAVQKLVARGLARHPPPIAAEGRGDLEVARTAAQSYRISGTRGPSARPCRNGSCDQGSPRAFVRSPAGAGRLTSGENKSPQTGSEPCRSHHAFALRSLAPILPPSHHAVGRQGAERRRFLQGQVDRASDRLLGRRRHYDIYARLLARHHGTAHPRQSDIVPAQHAGRRQPRAGELAVQRGAEGRHRLPGIIGRGTPFDPLLGASTPRNSIPQIHWLGSMNNEVSVCVSWHTSGVTSCKDLAKREVRGRRYRPVRRHRPVPAHHECGARHQIQDRVRLSRRQRHQSRDGARRGAGPLRLVVVERRRHPHGLVTSRRSSRADAARARKARRPAACSAGHRSRRDRRGAADPAPDLLAAGDGPAVPGAARVSGRSRRGAAEGCSWTRVEAGKTFLADRRKAKLEITPLSGDAVQKIMADAGKTDPRILQRTRRSCRSTEIEEEAERRGEEAELAPPCKGRASPHPHDRGWGCRSLRNSLNGRAASPWWGEAQRYSAALQRAAQSLDGARAGRDF